jgi:hypothetical protein
LCKINTMLFQAIEEDWISIYHVTIRCIATRSANSCKNIITLYVWKK